MATPSGEACPAAVDAACEAQHDTGRDAERGEAAAPAALDVQGPEAKPEQGPRPCWAVHGRKLATAALVLACAAALAIGLIRLMQEPEETPEEAAGCGSGETLQHLSGDIWCCVRADGGEDAERRLQQKGDEQKPKKSNLGPPLADYVNLPSWKQCYGLPVISEAPELKFDKNFRGMTKTQRSSSQGNFRSHAPARNDFIPFSTQPLQGSSRNPVPSAYQNYQETSAYSIPSTYKQGSKETSDAAAEQHMHQQLLLQQLQLQQYMKQQYMEQQHKQQLQLQQQKNKGSMQSASSTSKERTSVQQYMQQLEQQQQKSKQQYEDLLGLYQQQQNKERLSQFHRVSKKQLQQYSVGVSSKPKRSFSTSMGQSRSSRSFRDSAMQTRPASSQTKKDHQSQLQQLNMLHTLTLQVKKREDPNFVVNGQKIPFKNH